MLGSVLGGFLASVRSPALALGESSVPPLPSVTTPTLPVPPVPVPTPTIPAPDVPAPDVPAPDVPVSPELPAAPASDAPSADSVTPGPVSSTGGSQSGDGAPESSSGSRAPARGEEPRPRHVGRDASAALQDTGRRPPRDDASLPADSRRTRALHGLQARSHVRAGRRLPADGTARAERNALLGAGGRTSRCRPAPTGSRRAPWDGETRRPRATGLSWSLLRNPWRRQRPALDVRSEPGPTQRRPETATRRSSWEGAARTTRATARAGLRAVTMLETRAAARRVEWPSSASRAPGVVGGEDEFRSHSSWRSPLRSARSSRSSRGSAPET